MKKIGLVLGGGGARGLAHIGVLRVLENEKIPIHCISGTSMGAIIGACYAVNPSIAALEKAVREALDSALFSNIKFNFLRGGGEQKPGNRRTFMNRAKEFVKFGYFHIIEQTQPSMLDGNSLEEIITRLLPDIDITGTSIPFACVATDLTNGAEKIFTRGPLRSCVMASASIPGIFPPVEIDGIYYNDGGSVSVTPVRAARLLGGKFFIASDVKSAMKKWSSTENAREIISRSNYITGILLNNIHMKEADVIVSPDVKHLQWSDFHKLDFMIEAGEKAAGEKTGEIRRVYRARAVWSWFRRLFDKALHF